MRFLTSIFLVLVCAAFQQSAFAANACSQQPTDEEKETAAQSPCWDKALSQLAMNNCAGEDQKQADAELNKTYRQILARLKNDPAATARFKRAQRAWLAFRDAEIDALYADADRPHRGSVFPMCHAIAVADLTAQRTKALKYILEPMEGDVCNFAILPK